METGIQKAVRLAGTQTALGERLGLTPQAVQKWVAQGWVPSNRCRAVEAAFNGEITRAELNPKVYGDLPIPVPNKQYRRSTDKPKESTEQ